MLVCLVVALFCLFGCKLYTQVCWGRFERIIASLHDSPRSFHSLKTEGDSRNGEGIIFPRPIDRKVHIAALLTLLLCHAQLVYTSTGRLSVECVQERLLRPLVKNPIQCMHQNQLPLTCLLLWRPRLTRTMLVLQKILTQISVLWLQGTTSPTVTALWMNLP